MIFVTLKIVIHPYPYSLHLIKLLEKRSYSFKKLKSAQVTTSNKYIGVNLFFANKRMRNTNRQVFADFPNKKHENWKSFQLKTSSGHFWKQNLILRQSILVFYAQLTIQLIKYGKTFQLSTVQTIWKEEFVRQAQRENNRLFMFLIISKSIK